MSDLSKQILAILQLAGEPISTAQVSERLRAMGAAHPEDAHKRLGALRKTGAVVAVNGDGRKLRWRLGTAEAADRVHAKGRRKPPVQRATTAPSFTARVLEELRARPGITCGALSKALETAGCVLGRNEPSASLHNLVKQGRARHEGAQPNRRYYAVQASAVEATLPVAAAMARKPEAPTVAGGMPDRPPPAAPPAPRGGPASDDPIAQLADVIEQHLELEGGWHRSAVLAKDLDEEQFKVARALAMLDAGGRTSSRQAAGTTAREFAHPQSAAAIDWKRAEAERVAEERERANAAAQASAERVADLIAARPAASIETGPLEDSHGPIATESRGTGDTVQSPVVDQECAEPTEPAAEAPPAAIPDAVVDAALTLGLVQSDLQLSELAARESARVTAPERRWRTPYDDLAITLLDLVAGIATDIEDTIGRACDQRIDHRAIKALAGAAGMVRRAQIDLLRAA